MRLLPSPRRVLVLCAATVLLHVLAISWIGSHIEPVHDRPRRQPAAIVAQLHLAPPPAPAIAAVRAAPKPAARPAAKPAPQRPRPAPPPEPVEEAPAPDAPAAGDDAALAAVPAADAPDLPHKQSGAPASAPPVESSQQQAQDTLAAPSQPAQAPQPAGPRVFKTSAPPTATLEFEVLRREPDGSERSGFGTMTWMSNGHAYHLKIEAGISLLVTRLNAVVHTSDGDIGETGLEPVRFTEKRLNRALTATHFIREDGKITFSASDKQYPLLPGAQDRASLPFQLAAIARADPGQLNGEFEVQVGDDRDASVYRFVVAGMEKIETSLGIMPALHLVRPPRPGSYSAKLEVWLAPDKDWYPVCVRNTEGSGAVTTQTISKIVIER
ncbi:MAG: DUF3108 domain-containing protein [Telluria sp.]